VKGSSAWHIKLGKNEVWDVNGKQWAASQMRRWSNLNPQSIAVFVNRSLHRHWLNFQRWPVITVKLSFFTEIQDLDLQLRYLEPEGDNKQQLLVSFYRSAHFSFLLNTDQASSSIQSTVKLEVAYAISLNIITRPVWHCLSRIIRT